MRSKGQSEREKERYNSDPEYRAKKAARNKAWRINGRNTEAVMARRKYYTIKQNAKARKLELSVNAAYLREVLISQDRKCAITGRHLEYCGPDCAMNAPSIDRIDRTKGYIKGNIRWVTYQVNMALGIGTIEDLKDMCRDVLRV